MKKIIAVMLALLVLFAVTACKTETGGEKQDVLRIFSLKGPTSMGLAKLMDDNSRGETANRYECNMVTAADEITAAIVSGQADIATLPANAAATLYQKAGGFTVVAVNTLGVLYVVENGETIHSVKDLAGKTVYLTGKGTTPEFALRDLLAAHGIEAQVTLEFKSEATEVVTAMSADIAAVGLLPQPFVTSALMQNDKLRIALDLTEEWAAAFPGSSMVTGVTVIRNEILEKYPERVEAFLREYATSVDYVNQNPAEAAQWIEALGIVAKAAIAEKALPYCNLVCLTGTDMKIALSGYLQSLYDRNPDAVGGMMPDDEFYFTK